MLRYFQIKFFPNITTFILSVTVTYSIVCQEYRVGVKITWPGYLDPHPRLLFLKLQEIQLCVQEMLRYFQIKLFPNNTTLFYRSQLHVPLYDRNTGWGSRYPGLGILTPAQFDNFEIRNVVICQRRTQIILEDIYSSIVFSITTLFYQSQ